MPNRKPRIVQPEAAAKITPNPIHAVSTAHIAMMDKRFLIS